MRQVLQNPSPKVEEWQYVVIGCRMCDALWKFSSKEEATEAITMWGMGAFAYMLDCPRCGTKLAQEVPLYPYEIAMFKRLFELEQQAAIFAIMDLPEALRAEDV